MLKKNFLKCDFLSLKEYNNIHGVRVVQLTCLYNFLGMLILNFLKDLFYFKYVYDMHIES